MFAAVEIQTAEDGAAENHERMSAMQEAVLVINPTRITNRGEGHQVAFEMVDLVLAEVVALEGKHFQTH